MTWYAIYMHYELPNAIGEKDTVYYQKSDLNKSDKEVAVRGKKSSWFIITTKLEH